MYGFPLLWYSIAKTFKNFNSLLHFLPQLMHGSKYDMYVAASHCATASNTAGSSAAANWASINIAAAGYNAASCAAESCAYTKCAAACCTAINCAAPNCTAAHCSATRCSVTVYPLQGFLYEHNNTRIFNHVTKTTWQLNELRFDVTYYILTS